MPQFFQEVPYSNLLYREIMFFWIFILIIASWVSVEFATIFMNNLFYVTLGCNKNSTFQTFIVFMTFTLILFSCFVFLRSIGLNYENAIAGDYFNDSNTQGNNNEIIPPIKSISFFSPI